MCIHIKKKNVGYDSYEYEMKKILTLAQEGTVENPI